MSADNPFSNSPPALKLARRVATATAPRPPVETEAQRTMAADLAALQERENNLRAYEARLRAWQEQLDATSRQAAVAGTGAPFLRPLSQTPSPTDPGVGAAGEKFHRAQVLLEVEQNQLRDGRVALREAEEVLRRREQEVTAREARLKERELLLTITVGAEEAPKAAGAKTPISTIQRLTQAPWPAFKSGK